MKMQICIFLLFLIGLSLGQDEKPSLRTYYKVVYNDRPDSLYLNGKSVSFESDQIYEIEPGEYNIRAVKECSVPLTFQTQIRPNYQKLLRLDFVRNFTFESKKYDFLVLKDYAFTGIGIAGGFATSGNYLNALPLSLLGMMQHFLWKGKVKSNFDECTAVYSGTDYKQSNFRVSAALSSSPSMHIEIERTRRIIRRFEFSRPIHVAYITEEKYQVFNPSDMLSSYAFNLAIEGDILNHISAKAGASYFPFVNFEYEAKYYDEKFSFKNSHPLVVLELDLNFHMIDILDQKLSFLLGGIISNKIEDSFKLPLIPPDRPPFNDSSTTYINSDYSYQAIGGRIGIRSDYYISDKFSLYYEYLINIGYRFEVDGLHDNSFYYTVQVGSSWGF